MIETAISSMLVYFLAYLYFFVWNGLLTLELDVTQLLRGNHVLVIQILTSFLTNPYQDEQLCFN